MNHVTDTDAARTAAHKKIVEMDGLMEQCHGPLQHIAGISKLANKIKAERAFLLSAVDGDASVCGKAVDTSNLVHLSALVMACRRYEGVIAVLRSFCPTGSKTSKDKIHVDLVARDGAQWVKIVARNPRGIFLDWVGANSRSGRSIDEQAVEYVRAASRNPNRFVPPSVLFDFTMGVPDKVADKLIQIGVQVTGEKVAMNNFGVASISDDEESLQDHDDRCSSSTDESDGEQQTNANAAAQATFSENNECRAMAQNGTCCWSNDRPTSPASDVGEGYGGMLIEWVNLDVTAFVVLTSNLTHGHARYKFRERGLDEQARLERANPALPDVYRVIRDKRLMCCRTAYDTFVSILSTVGRDREKRRADELLPRVCVVDDRITQRVKQLRSSENISERAKV